jgi:hypothetical protein
MFFNELEKSFEIKEKEFKRKNSPFVYSGPRA